MSSIDSIKVRMYRQGFGDCFLLRFYSGADRVRTLLIDCGLKLNDSVEGVSMEDVRNDIAEQLKSPVGKKTQKPKLDILAITHEHWDHVSGFHPKQKLFDKFQLGELWMSWTEDPEDDDAIVLNKGLSKRIKALAHATKLLKERTVKQTAFFMEQSLGGAMLKDRIAFNDSLRGVADFWGTLAVDKNKTPGGISVKEKYKISQDTQDAMDHVRKLALQSKAGFRYMEPGTVIDNEKLLPGLRVYVLGPPKNKLLNKDAPSSGAKKEVYFGDSSLAGFIDGVLSVGNEDPSLDNGRPFGRVVPALSYVDADKELNLKNSYFHPKERYRRIDNEWLDAAGSLAMQMDSDTNNTSLVLAIEFIESGKVLLFPGDAQVGNWLSWHDYEWEIVHNGETQKRVAKDLLKNTVCYKAGHHSSHNATAKKLGLELMKSEDLVVLIPEKEKQYAGIPYKPLVDQLKIKAKGRVIFSADGDHPAEKVMLKKPASLSTDAWEKFRNDVVVEKKFVELTVKGK